MNPDPARVAPLLNPDASKSFFTDIKYERRVNDTPYDDDLDGKSDEDGPEDLNKDGFITLMRIRSPEGKYIKDSQEPGLMRKAAEKKGESGIYNIFLEGIDNDNDGQYNEDPVGGVDLNYNFQLNPEYNPAETNSWPSSEKETIALLEFLFDHPNIALVLNYSTDNTFINMLQSGKTVVSGDKIVVPNHIADFLGLDIETEYSITDIIEILEKKKIAIPGTDNYEEVLTMLSASGAIVPPDELDMPVFKAIQEEYKYKLKEANLNYSENRTGGIKKGSFVAFCYLRYGTHIFSTDLWEIPGRKNGLSKNEEHPDAYMLKWSDTKLNGRGFIDWQPYKHPALGDVEIGGFVPFLNINPPAVEMEKTITFHADFYIDLMGRLAELKIAEIKVKASENNFYTLTVHFTNPGWLPTSTAQGRNALTSLPITVRLKTGKDGEIYSGEPFETIQFIGGQGAVKKLEWIIKAKKGTKITLTADSPKIGFTKSIIELK